MIAITGDELQAWVETMSQQWRDFLAANPEVLALPCDIRETRSVAEFLQHIVAVELRYAQRLNAIEETPYEQIAFDSPDAIYASHDRAMSLLAGLKDRDDGFWDERIGFTTRSGGSMRVPRRVVFTHLLMHSVRHYAQLATLVRHHDFPVDWAMDYIVMRPKDTEK